MLKTMSAGADDFDERAPDRSSLLRSQFAAAVGAVLDTSLAESDKPPASPAFAQQLTEVAYSWATTALAPDLEAFARHSKRAQVGPEDVVLAARKNDMTHELVERESTRARQDKKRKTAGDGAAAAGS